MIPEGIHSKSRTSPLSIVASPANIERETEREGERERERENVLDSDYISSPSLKKTREMMTKFTSSL